MSDTRSIRLSGVLAVAPLLLLACGSSAQDDLSLGAKVPSGDVLRVDEICVPDCGGDEKVDAHVAYASTGAVQQRDVELVQYRVDYTLGGVADVPFYGARINNLLVAPGEEKVLNLVVVGAAQRSAVWRATGGAPVTGTAKITVAGYDDDNAQFFLETTFAVSFGTGASHGSP